jgi:maltooligosyltrehalose trehalohydrolase
MTALILLGPGTPMLFQGQEFAATSPFYFFADHGPELAQLVRKGRAEFLSQFRRLASPGMQAILANPGDPRTFELSKLDLSERETHSAIYDLHRDLLRLRREDPTFAAQRTGAIDGAVLSDAAFVLRFFGENNDDRLLLVNLGVDIRLIPSPEPLLAPPEGMEWRILWSSEDPKYGGPGIAPFDPDESWFLPGQAAVAFSPAPSPEEKILAARRRKEDEWRGIKWERDL